MVLITKCVYGASYGYTVDITLQMYKYSWCWLQLSAPTLDYKISDHNEY